MAVKDINFASFKSEVLDSKEPAVVDFYAPWCGPCRMMGPAFEELAAEMPQVKFFKINIDENEELVTGLNIQSVPTLMIFRDGELTARQSGAMNRELLKGYIESNALY